MRRNKENISVYEASEFWDDHDFTESDDVTEITDMQISLKKKKYVGIDMSLYALIRKKAEASGMTEDILINEWLAEKAAMSA